MTPTNELKNGDIILVATPTRWWIHEVWYITTRTEIKITKTYQFAPVNDQVWKRKEQVISVAQATVQRLDPERVEYVATFLTNAKKNLIAELKHIHATQPLGYEHQQSINGAIAKFQLAVKMFV